jgi:hypothetical protein
MPYTLAAAAMILALILLVLGTPAPSQNDDPSSRVAGRAGTLALYTWLGNLGLGFNVHRISGSFDTTGSDTLFIVDPRTLLTDADAEAVMQSLARGADLILAVSPESQAQAAVLLARLRVGLADGRPAGTSVPAQPIDAGGRVHSVPTAGGAAIEAAPYLTPLLSQGGVLTAVAEQVAGAGRAYVLASAFALSNDGLRDADSSTLVLSFLERARCAACRVDDGGVPGMERAPARSCPARRRRRARSDHRVVHRRHGRAVLAQQRPRRGGVSVRGGVEAAARRGTCRRPRSRR